MMRILSLAAEVVPFAKTGGPAGVAGALPVALERLGHDVIVVMPKYAAVDEQRWGLTRRDEVAVNLAGRDFRFAVWTGRLPESGVTVVLLANDRLFGRPPPRPPPPPLRGRPRAGAKPPATLFTIHNLGYMGLFPAPAFPALGLP